MAAGTLSLVTAASAMATTTTTWTSGSGGHLSPSGPPVATGLIVSRAPGVDGALRLTGIDQLRLTGTDQLTPPQADVAYRLTSVTSVQRASRVRTAETQYAVAQWAAAQKQAAAARAAAAAATAAAAAPAGTAGAKATATTMVRSGSPQQIAKAMLGSYGWSSSQFSCLEPLWAHESGWSVTAENPSGAYGIPQALPGAKMASAGPDWQTSAVTQIKWGLKYIKDTYGSPCSAWAHEQAAGWY